MRLLLILSAVIISYGCFSQDSTIWRSIPIINDTMSLDSAIFSLNDNVLLEGGQYSLKDGSFSGASKITFGVDSTDMITQINFYYSNETNYNSFVDAIEGVLGRPSLVTWHDCLRQTLWIDQETMFLIEEKELSGELIVTSKLFNR